MLFPDTPPNKALGRSPARVFGTLAFALAVLFYFLPVHSSTDNPNNGLWIGKFDINGKGPYQFDVLYINGEAVGRSDDAKVICRGNVSFKNGYYSEMDMFYKAGSPMGSTSTSMRLRPNRSEKRLDKKLKMLLISPKITIKLASRKKAFWGTPNSLSDKAGITVRNNPSMTPTKNTCSSSWLT